MSFARTFAQFVADNHGRPFPEQARRLAVDGVTDAVSCMLAGAAQPVAAAMRQVIALSAEPTHTMAVPCPATGGYTTPADAAFYGATITHALDYDDVNHPGFAHPSTLIVPALLALSPAAEASGQDLITAYICGVEMLGKLGGLVNPGLFEVGWHPTPALGPIAVATAAASLLRLSTAQTVAALSIAASAAGGLRANFGTMTKPLHAGQASRAGVVAALLASQGFSAADDAFGHQFGYFSLFGATPQESGGYTVRPGQDLEILSERGLEIKPYPACAAGQAAIEAGLRLHRELAGRGVRQVIVRTGQPTMLAMIHGTPSTPLEAKFSLPYCLAQAIVAGWCVLGSFSQASIKDPDILQVLERVQVEVDDGRRRDYYFGVSVRAEADDGSVVTADVPRAKGTVGRPMSEADTAAKFRDCAMGSLSEDAVAPLLAMLRSLDAPAPAAALGRQLLLA